LQPLRPLTGRPRSAFRLPPIRPSSHVSSLAASDRTSITPFLAPPRSRYDLFSQPVHALYDPIALHNDSSSTPSLRLSSCLPARFRIFPLAPMRLFFVTSRSACRFTALNPFASLQSMFCCVSPCLSARSDLFEWRARESFKTRRRRPDVPTRLSALATPERGGISSAAKVDAVGGGPKVQKKSLAKTGFDPVTYGL
jgi:hypothetical protein